MEYRKYFGEIVGTFALIFCGTGAIIINQESGGAITHLGIAITFGLIVASMIFALGDVSGAHLNPAVTLSFAVKNRFPWKAVLPYFASQTLGAFIASVTLKFLFPENESLGATIPAGSQAQSFILEVILTMILVMVIFNVTTGAKEKGLTAAIAIGGVVGLEALFAGPICGASMNPIRSISPALVSGHVESLWIYILAPTIGALLGVFIHNLLYPKSHVSNN
jgi:aquaporin Z